MVVYAWRTRAPATSAALVWVCRASPTSRSLAPPNADAALAVPDLLCDVLALEVGPRSLN